MMILVKLVIINTIVGKNDSAVNKMRVRAYFGIIKTRK